MNQNSIFEDRAIDLLYKYYSLQPSTDEEFVQYYTELTQRIASCAKNKEHIIYKIIHSGRSSISTFPIKRNESQLLVWDTAFWDLYEQFLVAFFSFDTQMSYPANDQDAKTQFWNGTENYLRSNTFQMVKDYYSTSPYNISLLEAANIYKKPSYLWIDPQTMDYIKEIISFAKEFVLLHELEHMLKEWDPEVFYSGSNAFINVAKYYRDHIVNSIDFESEPMDLERYKNIISDVSSDINSFLYSEIYSDYHAFFELLLHHNENFKDKSRPFSTHLPTYIVSLKLLKYFESYRNYVIGVIGKVLSSTHLEKSIRIQKILGAAQKASQAVYEREYLVIELISVTLGLHANEFNQSLDDFDILEFSRPYTDVMEPLINNQIKNMISKLLLP